MAKFLYLVEYVREDYITKLEDGTAQVNWLNSEEGSLFQEIVERVGLDIEDFDIDFVYKKVPEPKKFGRDGQVLSYKDPKQVEVGPYQALITKKILENDYQLVIPTGKLGLYLTEGNTRAITRTRGSQEQVTVKPLDLSNKQVEEADDKVLQELEGLDETLEKTQWIYPVFSVSYVMTRVNNLRILMRDLETVKEVSDKGEDSLLPSETSYNLLDTMEDVRKIFTFLKENEGKITTAWDLETNTLKPEMEGSKVLLTSIAWSTEEGDEGNAVTIPLEKKETPFTKEEQQEILGYLKEFLESDTLKATANGKFDIRFMMMRYGFEEFNNVVDVQTAFYLTVTQEKTVSFSLSNLTYDYTDMGGYDNELDKFKKDYIADYRNEHGSKPVNDIDGGNFNYDWIPLEIMHPYASGDVDATLRIYWKLKKNVDSNEKWKYLFYEWYPQLDVALSRVEASGMYLDTDYLDVIDKEYEKEVYRLVDEMRELPSVKQLEEENKMYYEAGLKEMELKPAERNEEVAKLRNKYKGDKQKFNPNSPDHKARVLYDIMGAKLPENHLKDSAEGKDINEATWRDYSTDKKALKEMRDKEKYSDEINTMARLLEEYSSVKTLRNNFVVKYPRYISSKTGAIHANFNSLGTECVTGDTLIVTDEGLLPIDNLSDNRVEQTFSEVELKVATREAVQDVGGFYYNGVRDGIKVTLYDGTEITTTRNHPLLVNNFIEPGKHLNRGTKIYQKEYRHDNTWKNVEDLTSKDYIAVKYGTQLYGKQTKLEYKENEYSAKTANDSYVTLPKAITTGLAEWLGMYMADGSIDRSNGTYTIKLSSNDEEVQHRFKDLTRKLFNKECLKTGGSKDRSTSLEFSGVKVGRFLEDQFNVCGGSINKNVPLGILKAPRHIQEGFIRGLTLDSSVRKKEYPHVYFCSVSKEMMLRVRGMLLNMGVYSRIAERKSYKKRGGHSHRKVYEVMVTHQDMDIFLENIGFIQTKKDSIVRDKMNTYQTKIAGRINVVQELDIEVAYVRVKKLEEVKSREFFDLNVPGSHSFVGNGVVNHNTSRLSSSDPNHQNIPSSHSDTKKFDYAHPIKRLFISRFKNGAILEADYSGLSKIGQAYSDVC